MADQASGFLSGLGTFRIWMSLLFLPLLIGGCVYAIWWVSRYQSTYSTGSAVYRKGHITADGRAACPGDDEKTCYRCKIPVYIEDHTCELSVTQKPSCDSIKGGWSKTVAFDKKDVCGTMDPLFMTPNQRHLAIGILAILTLFAVVMWIVNFAFRNNATWKNVSGAMEGADLLSSAFHR